MLSRGLRTWTKDRTKMTVYYLTDRWSFAQGLPMRLSSLEKQCTEKINESLRFVHYNVFYHQFENYH